MLIKSKNTNTKYSMTNPVPTTAPPVILRNRQLATNLFGINNPGQLMTAVPKYKFMFYARFVANSDAIALFPEMMNLGDAQSGISFKIRTIDKPKVDLTATELNQYNRKRWVYTKTEYSPLVIRMYDTVDNQPLTMWRDYFMYYFGDSRGNKTSIMNEPTVNGDFSYSTGWGLNALSETLCFFSRVELYSLFGGNYTQVNYLNPKITAIDWENYETASSDLSDVNVTLRYEALEYFDSAPITTDLMETFGFSGITTPVIEPLNSVAGAVNTYSSAPSTLSSTQTYSNLVNQQTPSSIISPNNSVMTNFGLNSALYSSYTQNNGLYAATTNYLPSISVPGNSYSNLPPSNQSISGIPGNSLPNTTQQIPSNQSLSGGSSSNSPLSVFGLFNFGN